MFLTLAIPNMNVELDTLEQSIYTEIESVKEGVLTQEELDRARTNIRAGIIRGLNNNTGLASNFASTYANKGDWREVFLRLDKINEVTLEDLQRVAQEYLTKDNRTVGATVRVES